MSNIYIILFVTYIPIQNKKLKVALSTGDFKFLKFCWIFCYFEKHHITFHKKLRIFWALIVRRRTLKSAR